MNEKKDFYPRISFMDASLHQDVRFIETSKINGKAEELDISHEKINDIIKNNK